MRTRSRNWRYLGRIASFFLCFGVVGYATACHKLTAQDLIGTWKVNYAESKLTLKLNSDGTFEQVLEQKDKGVRRRAGKWELTDYEGPTVLLSGALVVRDENGTLESDDTKGAWLMHVERGLGATRLTVNEDLGLYFAKANR